MDAIVAKVFVIWFCILAYTSIESYRISMPTSEDIHDKALAFLH